MSFYTPKNQLKRDFLRWLPAPIIEKVDQETLFSLLKSDLADVEIRRLKCGRIRVCRPYHRAYAKSRIHSILARIISYCIKNMCELSLVYIDKKHEKPNYSTIILILNPLKIDPNSEPKSDNNTLNYPCFSDKKVEKMYRNCFKKAYKSQQK